MGYDEHIYRLGKTYFKLEDENEEFITKMQFIKDLLKEQKIKIRDYNVKIDQLKVDIIDEETTLKEIEQLNRQEYERLEGMIGELNKKVKYP